MRLRLLLGDQLNNQHSWFNSKDPYTVYVMFELYQEAKYTLNHIQKITAFLSIERQ